MKELVAISVTVVGFIGLIIAGPNIYEFMGGRYEEARHNIYKESTAHVHGTIEHLNRLKLEYQTANNDQHKEALRQTILTSMGQTEVHQLPLHLQTFINSIR